MSEALPWLVTGENGAVCFACGEPLGGQLAEMVETANGMEPRHVVAPTATPVDRARVLLAIYQRNEDVFGNAIDAGTDTADVYDTCRDIRDELLDHLADALAALLATVPTPQPLGGDSI